MDKKTFWDLIEESLLESKGEPEKQRKHLVDKLSKMPEEEIFEYQKIFDYVYTNSYKSDLWAAAYIINGGCSDDGFDYFRAWMISKGKKTFENAMIDPQSLGEVIGKDENTEFEDFLSIGREAYRKKTGKEDFYDRTESLAYPEIEFDWNEDEDQLKNKFPVLFEKYW